MKIASVVLVVMVVAILSFLVFRSGASCKYVPVEGVVTAKEWVPARDDMWFMAVPDGNGGFTQIPQWTHYDEEWRIYVWKRHVRVSKEQFKAVEVQQHFKEGGLK